MDKFKTREQFDWIPIYEEIGDKIFQYQDNKDELLRITKLLKNKGFKTIRILEKDKVTELNEIDPFTFYANFNRDTTDRGDILSFLKSEWNLKSNVPTKFDGIPTRNNQKAWFFRYASKRGKKDIALLWELFIKIKKKQDIKEIYKKCIEIPMATNISMGMYYVSPFEYLPLDEKTKLYLNYLFKKKYKNTYDSKKIKAEGYFNLLEEIKKLNKTPVEISSEAHEFSKDKLEKDIEEITESNSDQSRKLKFFPKNLILYGPPGTGKTFITKRKAVEIIGGEGDD